MSDILFLATPLIIVGLLWLVTRFERRNAPPDPALDELQARRRLYPNHEPQGFDAQGKKRLGL